MAATPGSGLSAGPGLSAGSRVSAGSRLSANGRVPASPTLDRLSIELSNACDKACFFCYNHSHAEGETCWTPDEVVELALDCARHGIEAVSLGGGEPLQYPGLFEILERLDGVVFRSFTTNGLRLDGLIDEVVRSRPNKVHISLHFPERRAELRRVVRQVGELTSRGVVAGVNFLVRQSCLEAAKEASRTLGDAGIGPDRIVYLPMRGADTPTPKEMAEVAGTNRFQSMSCLLACAASPRFASIDWARRVAWCSYTESRRALPSNDFAGLLEALRGLELRFCGAVD